MTPSLFNYNCDDIWLCTDVKWMYATVSFCLWTNRKYVCICACCIWMCHCFVRDAPWHHHNCTCNYNNNVVLTVDEKKVRWYWRMFEFECFIALYTTHHKTIARIHPPLFKCNSNGIRLCTDINVDWICGTVSCWLWTNSKYVGIGACLNSNLSLLCVRWTTRPSLLHTRFLFNDNVTWLCAYVDIDWMYETVSYWLWTNRQYVGICVFLNFNVSLLGNRFTIAWHHRDCTLACYSHTILMAYGSAPMLIEYMERYRFAFGRTESTLVLVHVLIWICHDLVTMHHDTIAITHMPATATQIHYNDNDKRFRTNVAVICIYGTVSWLLWMNRKYVGIGACLNLNV